PSASERFWPYWRVGLPIARSARPSTSQEAPSRTTSATSWASWGCATGRRRPSKPENSACCREALVAWRAFHMNLHAHALFTFRYADPKWPIFGRILVLFQFDQRSANLSWG